MTASLAHPSCGPVRGLPVAGNVTAWLGIPYALPPAGERRFRAPQPVPPWQDVFDAREFGPAAPQRHAGIFSRPVLGPRVDEDCLRLNVWSPAADDARRPVMVWVHGGAFILGSARIYDGAHLASAGDIVVVTVNYRMGALGFVNFRDALGDASLVSNPGLRDVLAALQWVRDNIAAFGGDPGSVTLAGESAGSIMVSMLMASAAARPLFHRAIMQSGTFDLVHSQARSVDIAHAYLDALRLPEGGDMLARLQTVDVPRLLTAQDAVQRRMPGLVPSAPWFDDELVPASAIVARTQPLAPVPLLIGTNREESRLFEMLPGPSLLPVRRHELDAAVHGNLDAEAAGQVLATYPDNTAGNRQLATDLEFTIPALQLAERHASTQPTWVYRFDATHPMFGAVHALELSYLWNWHGAWGMLARGAPLAGERALLAERMRAHWIAFVRNGAPEPSWPRFDADTRQTLLFNTPDRVEADPDGERRARWPMLGGQSVAET